MNSVLITLQPLEPYFFGGEQNFDFGETKRQTQAKYFLKSEYVPSQTTLLGVLRYAILEKNGCLFTWSGAEQDKKERAKELVGESGFSFEIERDFGIIHQISPLFLIDADGRYYVKTPMNHNGIADTYTPFQMEKAEGISSGSGVDLFPSDYKAKKGYGGGYVCLDENLKIQKDSDIFADMIKTGINANRNRKSEDNKKSFFKREFKILKEPFRFAFFAELHGETDHNIPEKTVIYMGQSKSAFNLETRKAENDLVTRIKSAFKNKPECLYTLSDLKLALNLTPENYKFDFYIAQTKFFRYLKTKTQSKSYYDRFIKSEILYKLVCAGSVFYTDCPAFAEDGIGNKIGFNNVIIIGG